jgi:RHS repeat-associated protein
MNQKPSHTTPPPNSKAAAYGYGSYSSTTNKSMYVEISKPGYAYFGARYYDSELSVWLSVDPLASKFPHLSGYAYVANNPINLIDNWGLKPNPSFWHNIKSWFNRVRRGLHTTKVEVPKKERQKYEVMDVVYEYEETSTESVSYTYNQGRVLQDSKSTNVPKNPIPAKYPSDTEYRLDGNYQWSFSKKKWKNVSNIKVTFYYCFTFDDLDMNTRGGWKGPGNTNNPALVSFETHFSVKTKPITMRIPRGIFGIKRWRKATIALPEDKKTSSKVKRLSW